MPEVLIIGTGPAGWAAAAALAGEGVETAIISPNPDAEFRNGYGVWADEVEPLGLGEVFETKWQGARVHLRTDDGGRYLARPYARIDNRALRRSLMSGAAGARTIRGEVVGIEEDKSDGYRVATSDGDKITCRMVIDASGHRSAHVQPGGIENSGWQVACGWRIEVNQHAFPVDEAVLMDFRLPEETARVEAIPSFLYVLPEGPNVLFVEETSLVSRPPMTIDELRRRMEKRLLGLGVRPRKLLDEEERCFIPMGDPAPPRQAVVAFGGAARMVHPASGYMLARVLRTAPRLAEAVAAGLRTGKARDERSLAAWESVWSPAERTAHDLYRFGVELLLELDAKQTSAFFEAFFALPSRDWAGFLSGQAKPSEVRQAMLGVFARAPWTMKMRLVRAGLGPNGDLIRRSYWTTG